MLPEKEISLSKDYTPHNCEGIMTPIRTDIQATVSNVAIQDIDIQESTLQSQIRNTNFITSTAHPLRKGDIHCGSNLQKKYCGRRFQCTPTFSGIPQLQPNRTPNYRKPPQFNKALLLPGDHNRYQVIPPETRHM